MRKKISSLFLAFTLIITAFPTYAFASVEGVSVSEEGYVTSLDVSAPVGTSVFYEEGENGKFYLRQGDENSTNWNEDMTIGFSESVHKYFILCNNSTTGEIPISFKTNKDVTATCKIGSSEEKNVEISPDGIGTVTITAAEKKDADLVGQKTCKVELTFSKDDSSQTYELNFYRKGKAAKIAGLKINDKTPAGYDETNTSELNVAVENQFSIYVGSYLGPTHKISVYKEDNNIKTLITEKSFSMKDKNLSIDELDAGKYYIKYSNIDTKKGIVQYTHTLVINCIDNSPRKVNISIKNRETNEIISDALIKIFDSNKAEIQPDNDGYKLRPGKYTYVVKGKGYFTEQGDFLVDKNDRNIDVFMISSGEHKSSNVIERFYGEYYHAGTSDSGEEWTATQYENTDVYFTNIEKISASGLDYTINGTLASPTAMVTLVNAKGTSYPVSYSIKEGKRVFQSKIDFFAAGAQHFSISVSDDDTELRTYDLILNMPISNNSILEGLMLHNATDNSFLQTDNQPKNLITDNCFIKKSIVDTNQISLQLKRNGSDPKFGLLWSLGTWFSNDENWVRINNGDWSRATASANVSPSSNVLNLKKGLNIVDVWSEAAEVPYKLLNKHEEESDVGIPKRNARECETEFTTLLLYNQGDDSKENDLSSDLSIKDITAKQWIAKRVIEIDEFPVQREDGQYKVFLPETLYFPYIVLTIYPENPSDKIEVEGAIGERIGYNFVIPVKDKDKNKIQVKLSDSEGKTKIHTIDIVRKSSAAFIEELDVDNAELNKSFVKEQYNYELKPSQVNDEKITLKPILSEGSTLKVNGIRVSDNSVLIDRSTPKTVLEITAADGVTKNKYIFLLESGKISSTIIEKANSILAKGWMKDAAVEKAHYGNYWSVFQAAATGIDMHNSTFDVKPLNECKQATDYGATILQLVLMGENPYNYKGANYVEALAKDDTHTYANDIFRLMAFTAAGYDYDDALVERITKMSKSKSFDLDMKSWALIAVSPLLDKADLVAIADTFKDKLQHTGKDTGMFVGDYGANANTQGCVISALVSAGVDIGSAEWTINGINPLDVMEKYYVREDGKIYYINPENKPDYWTSVEYGYNKDFIIALGDIIAGSNVWQREALTRSKYNSLLCKAEQMIIKAEGTDKQRAYLEKKYNIAKDLIKDKNQNEIKGFGKTYYDLYEAMSFIDESMKLTDPTAVKVKSVSVNGNLKSEYQLNETFDPSEINFTIEYEDGTSEILTYDQVNIVGFDTNTSGKKPIRFEYKGKYSDVHYITVMAKGETPDQTDNAYITVKDPTGKTYVNKKTIRIEDGETAYSLLTKTGLNVSCKNSIYGLYVEGIEGLYEFDKGVGSGWMYCVNGVFPNYSSELYKIKQNDTVEWLYTTNYGVDIGAGGNFTPEVNKDVTTSGGAGSATTSSPTEVTVSNKTNADGTTESTAVVTVKKENQEEIIKQAKENKSKDIVLDVAASDSKGADNIQLELPKDMVNSIVKDTEATVTVKSEQGEMTIDRETLAQISKDAKGTAITVIISKVKNATEEQKKLTGENTTVYKLTVKSGNEVISQFNGKITVKLPIPTALLDKTVAAVHFDSADKFTAMTGKRVTEAKKDYYVFDTTHFSEFGLVDAKEAGITVDEPGKDDKPAKVDKVKKAKKITSKMKLTTVATKTKKKTVKVNVKMTKNTKANVKALKDLGYNVKYSFYRSTKKGGTYKVAATKKANTYTYVKGKKAKHYYYKTQIRVYDKKGKLITKTTLKNSKYASRVWAK